MNKRITFKGMAHSEPMEQYANQQLAKIVDFLEKEQRTPIMIDLMLEPSKVNEHHKITLLVKTPVYDLVSEYEHQGTDFYDVLDRVIDTMYRNLHEAKRKIVDDRKVLSRADKFKKER